MMKFSSPVLPHPITTIVGSYGSGKSEVAVNLSHFLARTQSEPVAIADLDIVNPYFRSREAARRLQKLGIRNIIPEGGLSFADLPIIVPEIKGAIENREGKLILDVGGDDTGARVLSSLHDAFASGTYDMFLVLNGNRPFTSTVDGCLEAIANIEESSRLKFTGIISNTHMLEYTTADIVLEGLKLAKETSQKSELPIVFLSAMSEIVEEIGSDKIDVPVLPLDRYLLKPWEKPAG